MIGALVLNGEKFKGKIEGDIIVGVDGGYDKAPHCDVFIGDKDSVKSEVNCSQTLFLPTDKSASDGEYALKYLLMREKIKKINIYGLVGGRIDHILANIGLMALSLKNDVPVVAHCNNYEIYITNSKLSIPVNVGTTLSLSTFTDQSHIISLKGVKWQLENEDIFKDSSRTLSNVAVEKNIDLEIGSGIVLVIVNKNN